MESFPGLPVQWTEQAVHIKEFASKHPIPNVVKVIKGQYRNIGVAKSVHSELYLHNVQTMNKILAEAIRLKDGRSKMIVSEQKYSLPMTYKGWFEVLSQDGKSAKAIQNVQELALFKPPTCLVRENIKGFITNGTSELTLEHSRVVTAGEVMTLAGEMWIPFPMGKSIGKRRILKCIDSKGIPIYFGLEQKGIFSPIAGQTNISGVHNIMGIVDKFRMPVLVRLVHGVIPSKMEKGFTGIFRFTNIYTDENAFVCPLRKDSKMVSISTREPMKLVTVQNYEILSSLDAIQQIQQKCREMMDSYLNSIHILISMPDVSMFRAGEDLKTNKEWLEAKMDTGPAPARSISQEEEDILFQEIEGIYQYVREGGLPPPPLPRPSPQRLSPPKPTIHPNMQPSNDDLLVPHCTKVAPSQFRQQNSSKKGFGDMFDDTDDDPLMEIKMQELYLDDEEEDEGLHLRRQESYSWEEPIYEPLEKIRQHKLKLGARKSNDESHQLTIPGLDTPPDSTRSGERSPGEETSSNVAQVSSPMDSTAPVANLRQVMRSSSISPDVRPNSTANLQNHASESGDGPPPLPPKRHSGVNLFGAKSKGLFSRNGKIGHVKSPPGKYKSANDGTANPSTGDQLRDNKMYTRHKSIEDEITSPRVKLNSNGHHYQVNQDNRKSTSPQKSFHNGSSSSGSSNSPQTGVSSGGTPKSQPYVAVARVRNYQHDAGTASVHVNPEIYRQSGKNMQSMYL